MTPVLRRWMIVAPIVLVVAGAGVVGWRVLRPHDPLGQARALIAKGDDRAAQLVLRGAVAADPAVAEAHFQLAQVQARLGDPIAAEKEYRAARDRGWDAHVIQPLLAQAIVAQGRASEVLRDYAPDGLPPDQAAGVLVARAQAYFDLHRPAEAAAAVARAQSLDPASLQAALTAAQFAVARNDAAEATTHVNQALAIDPKSLEALMLRAGLLAASADRPGAIAAYAAALDQARDAITQGAIRIARAGLLLSMDQDAAARADVDAVLKTQPKQPLANYLSGRLFARAGDWKAADAALTQVGPILQRLPGGDMTLAAVKFNVGDPEQAIAAAQRQVARTPDNIAAVKLLARLDLIQKRPQQAAEALAGAAGHLDAEALDMMGRAYAADGQAAKALAALRQASTLAPLDTGRLTQLAALELREGDVARGMAALDRALDLTDHPQSADAAPPAASPAQLATALSMAALQAGDVDRAAAALERLRAAKGDPAQIESLDGLVKLARIDLDGARAAFEAAGRLDPKAPGPRVNLARVLALQGHPAEAVAALEAVLATDPANASALTSLVDLRLAQSQPDRAVAAAEAARQAAPNDHAILAGLAALYVRVGQPRLALDRLDAAGGAESTDQALLSVRAQAQIALNERGAAVTTLRALLGLRPDDVGLRRRIALLLSDQKQYDAARDVVDQGLARTPGDATLLATSVAVAGAEGGPAASLAKARELARDPANPAAVTLTGDVLLTQRKFADAAAAFDAAAAGLPADDPRRALLRVRAATAVAAGGDQARSNAMLRDFLAAHPESTPAALALSAQDIAAKRLPAARDTLEAVVARDPNDPVALNNLAWVSQQLGALDRASELASRAYLLGPSPQTADTLGWILLAQGRVTDALALLREAAGGQPTNPVIHYHLAAALARDGQTAAAHDLLKAVLAAPAAETFPEKPLAAKLLSELAAR